MAAQIVPDKRFLIILDEFDEIHEQLYLSGDSRLNFFRKFACIVESSRISGLVLVGGENMPYIMERQGQKLKQFLQNQS